MEPTMPDRFLNQTELAARWNVSPRTLERWRWEGGGPPHLKIGSCVRYRLRDVEDFEAGRIRDLDVSSERGTAGFPPLQLIDAGSPGRRFP